MRRRSSPTSRMSTHEQLLSWPRLQHYLEPRLASPWPLPKPSPSPRVSPQLALCHSSQLASAVASLAATPPWRLGHRLRQGRPQRRFSHHHNHRPGHSYSHRHNHRFGAHHFGLRRVPRPVAPLGIVSGVVSGVASRCVSPSGSASGLEHRLEPQFRHRLGQRLGTATAIAPCPLQLSGASASGIDSGLFAPQAPARSILCWAPLLPLGLCYCLLGSAATPQVLSPPGSTIFRPGYRLSGSAIASRA